MDFVSIDSFEIGNTVNGFFLCKKKHIKTTRLGDTYLDLLLKDSTGTIRAKVWSNVDHFSNRFNEGDIIAAKGIIISYNDTNEINIKFIKAVIDDSYIEYGFSESLIFEEISQSKEKLIKYIFLKIKSLDRKHSILLNKIYKSNLDKVESIPLPIEYFEKNGGYLLFIYKTLHLFEKIKSDYKELDYNKVITCILLFKLGYLDYYNLDSTFSVSEKGKALEPHVIGMKILMKTLLSYSKIAEKEEIYYYQCIFNKNSSADKNIDFVKSLIDLQITCNNY